MQGHLLAKTPMLRIHVPMYTHSGVTPPTYGCRKTAVSVNLRTRPCATASVAATLAAGTYFHFTGNKFSSTCGDRYTWVQVVWNNAVRYMANADPATGKSYAVYCPLMRPDPSPYPTTSNAFIASIARSVTAMQRASNIPASVTIAQASCVLGE